MSGSQTKQNGVPWRSPYFYILLAVAVITPMDIPLISPTLPPIQTAFELTATEASLVITVFALPGIFLAPLIGVVADKIGRKPVLISCLFLYGITGSSVMLTTQFWQILALRFVQGIIGGSILASLALTVVGDLFTGRQQNTVIGVLSAALLAGSAAYPIIGGYLSVINWRFVYGLYVVSIIIALFGVFFLDESGSKNGNNTISIDYFWTMGRSLDIRQALLLYGATFIGGILTFGAIFTGISFYLANDFGMSTDRIGLLLTSALFSAVLVSGLNGQFSRLFSDSTLIIFGVLCYGLGLIIVATTVQTPIMLAGLAVSGTGHGFTVPSISSGLTKLSSSKFRGSVMSLRTSVVLASQAIAPPLFTIPASKFSYQSVLLLFGICFFATGAIGIANARLQVI